MTLQNMLGVVLWTDTAARKAVIWCEDQGELAFYTPGEGSIHDTPALDAGDLIQFDVTVRKNMRQVSNPQVVMQSHSPDLAKNLRSTPAKNTEAPRVETRGATQKVIDLATYFDVKPQHKVAYSG